MRSPIGSSSDEHEGATPRELRPALLREGPIEWGRVAIERMDSATVVSGFGAIWAVLALVATVGGPRGTILGFVVAFVWISTSAPVAYAVAHFSAIPVLPPEVTAIPFVLVEIGLVIMLLGTLRRSPVPVRSLVVSIVAFIGLVGVVTAVESTNQSIITQAVALIGVGLLLSYLIHRFEYSYVALLEDDSP